jgi:hypothetical protein
MGDVKGATSLLEAIKSKPDFEGEHDNLAWIYAGLGEWGEMFDQFNLALENRTLVFRLLRYSALDPKVKQDPRYAELFQKVNLIPP